jgi:hypothetical protein
MESIEIINERTNQNTKNISKVFGILFGNGKKGLIAEHTEVRANLIWIKTLLILNLTALVGMIFKSFLF